MDQQQRAPFSDPHLAIRGSELRGRVLRPSWVVKRKLTSRPYWTYSVPEYRWLQQHKGQKTPSCLLTKNFLLPPLFWCKKLQKAGRNNKLHGVPVFSKVTELVTLAKLLGPVCTPCWQSPGNGDHRVGVAVEAPGERMHAGHLPCWARPRPSPAFPRISPRGTKAGSMGSGE